MKIVVLGAVAAVGSAALCFYKKKQKDEQNDKKAAPALDADVSANKSKVGSVTKESFQTILTEMVESQSVMRDRMKELTKELIETAHTFEQAYERVKKHAPTDPLEKHNLSMEDFDQLLDTHQSDPTIRESIAKIMGAPNPGNSVTKASSITVKEIIKVHTFMLKELESLVTQLQEKQGLCIKTVTIAAQTIVGAQMEKEFGYTSADIESAVLMHHSVLATDQEFSNINMKIQHTMGKLMGNPFGNQ